MPTLYLTCGLPGSGKTTLAKKLELEVPALRLTGDEWMHELYPGISTLEAETGQNRSRVEGLQWEIALRALKLGCNVVVDWGLWSKEERDHCRTDARALGSQVVLCLLDVPLDELRHRLSERNANLPPSTFGIPREALLRWSQRFQRPTHEELTLYDPPHAAAGNALSQR